MAYRFGYAVMCNVVVNSMYIVTGFSHSLYNARCIHQGAFKRGTSCAQSSTRIDRIELTRYAVCCWNVVTLVTVCCSCDSVCITHQATHVVDPCTGRTFSRKPLVLFLFVF